MNFLSCRQLLNNSSVILGNTAVLAYAVMDRKKKQTPRTEPETSEASVPVWPLNSDVCLTLALQCFTTNFPLTVWLIKQSWWWSLSHPKVQTNRHQAACLSMAWRSCRSLGSHFLTSIFIIAAPSSSHSALYPSLTSLSFLAFALTSRYISGAGVYRL